LSSIRRNGWRVPSKQNIRESPSASNAQGAERIYQRIIQEQASRIYAVDVVCSTDPSHFLDWTAKDKDWVAPYVTEDMAKAFSGRPARSERHARDPVRMARSHRLQHQSGEGRRTRPKAMSICSTRNGRESLSKAIPVTVVRY
jgi:hypothetical protein